MAGKPAARVTDSVTHVLPPVLSGGPGSPNVFIGGLPAWRGIPSAQVSSLKDSKKATDQVVRAAEALTIASIGTPQFPSNYADEGNIKQQHTQIMNSAMLVAAMSPPTLPPPPINSSFPAVSLSIPISDIHQCNVPLAPFPAVHGPGVVIDGSQKVFVNGLPACRVGNTIMEAIAPLNQITNGCMTVLIGG